MEEIRTRVAPSPTGDPHIGTAYIALFNMVFAKKHKGKFILRIEDTDRTRSTKESEDSILKSLNWLEIKWDEGPDIGGEFGPYRQSERYDIYQKYTKQLIDKECAFYCFCSNERLNEVRKKQQKNGETQKYDGHCLNLSKDEIATKISNKENFVVRMKIPENGICEVYDMLRGKIEINWNQIDMQILMKTDGFPTYFLANVVDDHLMRITHVLRGEEWLPSAPKIIKLYEYFGWDLPKLFYMPLLRNIDKSKLSKRKNPTSLVFYKKMGYLPEAVVNYLGRMGYSIPNEEEKFSLDQMIESFDINRISLGGPIFDITKLDWLNGLYLRNLNNQQFIKEIQKWTFNSEYIEKIIPLIKTRLNLLSDLPDLIGFFFSGEVQLKKDMLICEKIEEIKIRQFLQLLIWKFEQLREWKKENIFSTIKIICEKLEIRYKNIMTIIFISITGKTESVSVLEAMEILGSDLTRYRLNKALKCINTTTKKENKEWDKIFQSL